VEKRCATDHRIPSSLPGARLFKSVEHRGSNTSESNGIAVDRIAPIFALELARIVTTYGTAYSIDVEQRFKCINEIE
jgi:hypothetical protein